MGLAPSHFREHLSAGVDTLAGNWGMRASEVGATVSRRRPDRGKPGPTQTPSQDALGAAPVSYAPKAHHAPPRLLEGARAEGGDALNRQTSELLACTSR